MSWPEHLPVSAVRFARPTDRLAALIHFYVEEVGLPLLKRFSGAGYDGALIGLPELGTHLEFTQHIHGSPAPGATADSLLVLYFRESAALNALAERLQSLGHPPVAPENPWWLERAVTFQDPDGHRLVLCEWGRA